MYLAVRSEKMAEGTILKQGVLKKCNRKASLEDREFILVILVGCMLILYMYIHTCTYMYLQISMSHYSLNEELILYSFTFYLKNTFMLLNIHCW